MNICQLLKLLILEINNYHHHHHHLGLVDSIIIQAFPGSSRATCEECVAGLTNLPGDIANLSDVLETDMSHHYCHKPGDPCYIQQFVYDWFPAVLDQFVGGAAQ